MGGQDSTWPPSTYFWWPSSSPLLEDDRASNSTDPIRKPKKRRPGSPYVKCGRWTNRVVNIGDYNEGVFEADKNVKMCCKLSDDNLLGDGVGVRQIHGRQQGRLQMP